ncbi:MAG: class I SAM-dependent methyltransferase [Bacteroidales bacterium]|jgi:SAM-dependent methyltransferase|nr:class I SAM-dependent methyltransferase [Bacteroidales bacterium]
MQRLLLLKQQMNTMHNPWDERYNRPEYIYGTAPNKFFKEFIEKNKPGKLLLPGEGEGRNSVYAARAGWEVTAFDSSAVARAKALDLARQMKVSVQYELCSVMDFEPNHTYDLISLIYLHLKPEVRKPFHQKLMGQLNEQGHILIEAFSREQIHKPTGGPKNLDLLYSVDELRNDFDGLHIHRLEHITTHLEEGSHHQGEARVIRMLASKK